MGLSWPRQYAKLSADQTACVAFKAIQVPGDDQARKHMIVSLETFAVWLARLQPSRVKAEVRDTVIAYQREAGRALREHFFGQPQREMSEMSKADWIRQALEIEEERERLARENTELREENAAMVPVVEEHELLVAARGLVSMTVFAQQSGITRPGGKPLGERTAIEALRALRILKDAPGTDRHNTPYQEHAHRIVAKVEQRGPVTVNVPYVAPAHVGYLAARINDHFWPGRTRLPRPRFGQLRAIEGGA
jgi:phage antirepressor YoqD-like protein